jgi:hypothetical protein
MRQPLKLGIEQIAWFPSSGALQRRLMHIVSLERLRRAAIALLGRSSGEMDRPSTGRGILPRLNARQVDLSRTFTGI